MEFSLKETLIERIGLFGDCALKPDLEKAFGALPYQIDAFQDLNSFNTWMEENRPRMVLLDQNLLMNNKDSSFFQTLKENLSKLEIISLILTSSIQEINYWRNMKWPRAHFSHGAWDAQFLKHRMINLLGERLLFERPLVAIMSSKPHLADLLEIQLKDFGFRVRSVADGQLKNEMIEIFSESPRALICEMSYWEQHHQMAQQYITPFYGKEMLPHYYICDTWDESQTLLDMKNKCVYAPHHFHQLVLRLHQELFQEKQQLLEHYRCTQTGLYLPNVFVQYLKKELAAAHRYGDSFCILKMSLNNMEELETKYGFIFAKELEFNLGLFIHNRVRSSDLVLKGNKGEIFVLLSRVTGSHGLLIGERLNHYFASLSAFNDSSNSLFKPQLEYIMYNYPDSIKNIEDIEQILNGTFPQIKAQKHQIATS